MNYSNWAVARIDRLTKVAESTRSGKGSFKTVYEGEWGGNSVAVSEVTSDMISHEVSIMANLSRHPNLVQIFGICKDEVAGVSLLVMELLPLGSLSGVLHKMGEDLSARQRLTICSQVASGMQALAQAEIVHADLACRNVLVQSMQPLAVKVADFGLSKTTSLYYGDNNKIPFRWSAPEVLRKGKWTEKSDVWAFGVTMWEIYTSGDVPYGLGLQNKEVEDMVVAGATLKRPRDCSDAVWDIMSSCWAFRDAQRPTFAELCTRIYKELDKEAGSRTGTAWGSSDAGGGSHPSTTVNTEDVGTFDFDKIKRGGGQGETDPSGATVDSSLGGGTL